MGGKKQAVKGYNEPFFETHFQPVSIPLSEWIVKRTRITANQLTWWSLIACAIAGISLSLAGLGYLSADWVLIAGIASLAFWVLDTIDGKVARLRKQTSLFGAWLDVTFGTTGMLFVLVGTAIFVQDAIVGSLFVMTYILKFFLDGTFQEYYRKADTGDDLTHTSYAPNGLATLVAAMNATNTIFISVFVASVIWFYWSDIFFVMASLYIALNGFQSVAMLAIQYRKMRGVA